MQRILIVEDHLDARQAMEKIVRNAFGVALVDSASTLQRAREMLSKDSYDLIVLDLGLPDGKGEDFILEISNVQPNAYVVISTIHDESDRLLSALENGAKGYLLKEQSAEFLASEFRGIMNGKPPLAPAVTRRLLEVVRSRRYNQDSEMDRKNPGVDDSGGVEKLHLRATETIGDYLTDREREILGLLGKGFSRPEIAGILSISKHTVATHLSKVYDKLGITNRSEATLMAIELGLS